MDEPTEPDPRFTLANERTFLAWIRTALALIAGGVALAHLSAATGPSWLRTGLAVVPVLAGAIFSALAFTRWRSCERALRTGEPLPPPRFALGLTTLVVVAGVVLTLTLAFDQI